MKVFLILFLLALPAQAIGQKKVSSSTVGDSGTTANRKPIPEGAALSADRLIPLDEESITALFKEKKGKVLLVNLWATWCGPCVREFPELVKLHDDYFEKGLEVLFVSIDNPAITETRVKPFLEKQKITFPSYIKMTKDDGKFFTAIGKGFANAIPTTFIYDRSGKQVATLVGARSYKDFENVLRPLLGLEQEETGGE